MPATNPAASGSDSVSGAQPILSSRFCEVRLVFTNSTATGSRRRSVGRELRRQADVDVAAEHDDVARTGVAGSARAVARAPPGSRPTGRGRGRSASPSMSLSFTSAARTSSGRASFQVRAITDGLPSSRHRAVDRPSSPNSQSRCSAPRRTCDRVEHGRRPGPARSRRLRVSMRNRSASAPRRTVRKTRLGSAGSGRRIGSHSSRARNAVGASPAPRPVAFLVVLGPRRRATRRRRARGRRWWR